MLRDRKAAALEILLGGDDDAADAAEAILEPAAAAARRSASGRGWEIEDTGPPIELDPQVAAGRGGVRRLEVLVRAARHLPKMDALSSADPYCEVTDPAAYPCLSVRRGAALQPLLAESRAASCARALGCARVCFLLRNSVRDVHLKANAQEPLLFLPQVDFAGQRCQTAVRRETYDPDWEEAFGFDVHLPDGTELTRTSAAYAGPGPLRATLQDWNRVGGPEKIGEVVIGSGRMWDVVRAPLGWEEDRKYPVRRGGKVRTSLFASHRHPILKFPLRSSFPILSSLFVPRL